MCKCERSRIHEGAFVCKFCIREAWSFGNDPFPDLAQFGSHGVQVDSRVGRRAYVAQNVLLGQRVRIHDLAMVGSRPFEFLRNEEGCLLNGFPRSGSVQINDDVEVFPFANIDAGFLDDTIVGARTKIDHHVHVGHNAIIGEDTLLCAGAIIGGHANVGDGCFIGINASIKPRVTIGHAAIIGMGAVVLEDVPAGETWAGNPARKIK